MYKQKTENENILEYAINGLSNKDISAFMARDHGLHLSANAVKKRLQRMRFPIRRGPTIHSREEIKQVLQEEMKLKPRTVGYRFMKDLLQFRGYHVRRNIIMELMREIDPEGTELRRRRRLMRRVYRSNGPNHTWHVDGYDKLKPFGFAIHGAIDGFSRKVLWLYVGPSNNDPNVITSYYIKCIEEVEGAPKILQVDPGTENGVIGALQLMFNSDEGSFRITKSAFNQRIEAWWSILRRRITDWWIDFFNDMIMCGELNKDDIDEILCLRFCFSKLIQKEIDEVVQTWNYHHISHSRQAVVPNGKPIVLYNFPELTGAVNCKVTVCENDLEWAKLQCSEITLTGSSEFDDRARKIMMSSQYMSEPENWKGALERYFYLRDCVRSGF